jgi:hypothetical protein
MIAPWHEPSDDPEMLVRRRELAIVRRMVAAALLPQGESALRPAAAWRAWIWAGWMAITMGAWFANFGL